METRPYVSWKLIGDFMTAVFEKVGVPRDEAAICAEVLMESDRRGIEATAATVSSPSISTASSRAFRSPLPNLRS